MSAPNSLPKALIQAVASHAQETGWFRGGVATAEPKSAPNSDTSFAVWASSARPVQSSGLISTSFRIELAGRIYIDMMREPIDDIDPEIMAVAWDLLTKYSSGFTLGGLVRQVDLFGSEGDALGLEFGYIAIDRQLFRVATFVIPLIVNDQFDQGV